MFLVYTSVIIIIIIIIKGIYIAQVRKGHKCAMSAEMAVCLRNCLLLIWTASVMTFTTIHLDILFAECTDYLLRGDCHVATKLATGEACRTFILRGGRMSWTWPAVGLWGRAWRA